MKQTIGWWRREVSKAIQSIVSPLQITVQWSSKTIDWKVAVQIFRCHPVKYIADSPLQALCSALREAWTDRLVRPNWLAFVCAQDIVCASFKWGHMYWTNCKRGTQKIQLVVCVWVQNTNNCQVDMCMNFSPFKNSAVAEMGQNGICQMPKMGKKCSLQNSSTVTSSADTKTKSKKSNVQIQSKFHDCFSHHLKEQNDSNDNFPTV